MNEKKKPFNILILLLTLISLIIFQYIFTTSNYYVLNEQKNEEFSDINSSLQNTVIKQWINNPTFESPIEPGWFWKNGTEGDNSDMNASTSTGQANFEVLGDIKTFTVVSGTINSSTSPGWEYFNKTGFLPPDTAEIRSYGCYVSHFWNDGPNQFPSAQWRTNVSVPIDMSDYVIISASLEVIVNATVDDNVDTPNDNGSWDNFAIGDSVTFYSQISDLEYNPPLYTVASNKTKYLGQQNASVPTILTIPDSPLETVSQIDLITALNSAFEKDPSHSNFTLTLGIDIYSEDNLAPGADDDTFSDLIIKTCNLTFTCQKRIDQFTALSWNQIGNSLSGSNIQITDANFNFDYKLDKYWPTSAPLSEIRFYINDKIFNEGIIKINAANTTLQEAKSGGFNVLGFIEKDVNISISIEVYLKDNFELNETLTISIDNVYLNITYIETLPDLETNLQLFLNGYNKTLDPLLELPVGEIVNITVKFTNGTGDHLSGAKILIMGDKVYGNLTEDVGLEQYFIILNTTDRLNMGVNLLTIETTLTDYQSKIINPRITVRKIYSEVVPTSGSNIININSGEDASLQIMLNNTDYGGNLIGAVVTYSWLWGDGVLTDQDNDGIYTGIIEGAPIGSHTVIISVYAGDSFLISDYEIILNVIIPSNPLLNLLVYALIGGIVSVSVGFLLYQTRFKYPKTVRKIRKLKKKVGKGKKLKQIVVNNRNEIINNKFIENTQEVLSESVVQDVKNDKIYGKSIGKYNELKKEDNLSD